MDITSSGNLIVTLSFPSDGKQNVKVWDWENYAEENPILNSSFINVEDPDYFNFIKWNYSNESEFVTTGQKLVRFWKREHNKCSDYSPFIVKSEDKKKEFTREFT